MIIDFHTHAFPENIAEEFLEKMRKLPTGMRPKIDGTYKGIKRQMEICEIDKSVILPVSVTEAQQRIANDFISENQTDEFIGFGSVSPFSKNALEELERIKSLGLKGVKFHPGYQGFFVDDENMKPIYKKINQLGLIVVFHAGEEFGSPSQYSATPKSIERAFRWIESPVVCTHWGGFQMGDEVLNHLCHLPIYFDTALGFASMPKSQIEKLIEAKGIDYILFGSDTPWQTPAWDIEMINTLSISYEEKEKIYYKNAQKLLGL